MQIISSKKISHLRPNTTPFFNHTTAITPPISIPKYPPPPPSKSQNPSFKPSINPAFKTTHLQTKYYKPVTDGVSYLLPGAPFEFQYSYSETPKVKPVAIREPAFLPFAPPTMPRPWTEKAPMKKLKKKILLFHSSYSPEDRTVQRVEMVRATSPVKCNDLRSRKEILGEPLRKMEIIMLITFPTIVKLT